MGICHSSKQSSNVDSHHYLTTNNNHTATTTTSNPSKPLTNNRTDNKNKQICINNAIEKDIVNNNNNNKLESTQPKTIKQVRNFIPKSENSKLEDIYSNYKLLNQIGSGSFGVVRVAESINPNNTNIPKKDEKGFEIKKLAIKTIEKDKVEEESFLREEIECSLQMQDDNIIKCYEVYEDPKHVYFVMEIIDGGDLFDYIINSPSGRLEERESLYLFKQMVLAVQYMHAEDFMHRDIKPENFLVYVDKNDSNKLKVKLTDFGFACKVKNNEKKTDKVGSINYVAPEMLDDLNEDAPYDNKVDVWALGVCLYNMLSGKQPFADDDPNELARMIRNNPVTFHQPVFNSVNHAVKDFISFILNKDPEERPSSSDLRTNQWLNSYLGGLDEAPTIPHEVNFYKKNVDNIIKLLDYKRNIKPDFWGLCIENLKTSTAASIYKAFLEDNKSDLFAQKLMSFKELIGIIIDYLKNESEKNSNNSSSKESYLECIEVFNNFLVSNKEDCINQMINYIDFFDKLVKSGELLYREKVWNLYKNLITYDDGNSISISSLIELMDKKKMNYRKENLKQKNKMNFDELFDFFISEKIEFN